MDYTDNKPYAPYTLAVILVTVLAGVITAVVTVLLGKLLSHYLIGPALCSSGSASSCSASAATSLHIAAVIATIAGVGILIRGGIYRPLLVGVSSLIATWPLHTSIAAVNWGTAILILLAITTTSYLVFSWVLRLYNFIVAAILLLLITLAALFITLS